MAKISADEYFLCVWYLNAGTTTTHIFNNSIKFFYQLRANTYSVLYCTQEEFNEVDKMIILRFRRKVGEIHAMLSKLIFSIRLIRWQIFLENINSRHPEQDTDQLN